MSLTGMPYRWTLSAEITNGMTRGALGFGNWIAVALFAADESLYRNAKDVLHIAAGTGDDQGGIHPSRKPIRLINELIELFTNKDDLIVDPFLGSGTTLIAADKLGRRCIGAELDPDYCAHIIKRYEEQTR
jgi:DNA modification methylase